MRRKILFRGYNLKNQKWLYGYYLVNRGQHFICPEGIQNPLASWEDFVVDPESIGQYTETKDEEGKEIYEGDIVRRSEPACNYADGAIGVVENDFEVIYDAPMGYLPFSELGWSKTEDDRLSYYKVIGNTYEHKELLEGEE